MKAIGTLFERMSAPYEIEVSKATDALNMGQAQVALEIVESILREVANQPDALLMKGIALSQLGQNEEASKVFVAAVTASPNSVKARFNAAVHEYNAGRVGLAQQLLQDALKIDPNHVGSMALLERIMPIPAPTAEYPRPDPTKPAADVDLGVPFVSAMGPYWVALGWILFVLMGLSTVVTFYAIFTSPAFQQALSNPKNLDQVTALSADLSKSIPIWAGFLDIGARFGALIWLIIDLNHRRGNYLWVLPFALCGCMLGLGWMVMPLYLLLGRNPVRFSK